MVMDARTSETDTWTVAQAKAKLSEVIDKARHQRPQAITRNGKRAVVVVDAAQWERIQKQGGGFADFLMSSPLRGSGLEVNRRVASTARELLLKRLAAQKPIQVGRWSRDELYQDEA
jgi:prevent-host-death family protein